MGSSDWAPSSRVLQQPGGASSINLFGGYSESPVKPQQRRAGGARIINGKIVLPEGEMEAKAAAYTAACANPTAARPQFGEPGAAQAPVAAASEPEMRGCEGYTPNLAAFADGGLTSSSTELGGPQQVGRSSTRLHAPPGGASQICFGSDPAPAPAPRAQFTSAQQQPQPQQQQQQPQQHVTAGAVMQSPCRKAPIAREQASSVPWGRDESKPAPFTAQCCNTNANITVNGAEPEMRGCEGYKPNYGAFANGGLTSSSTELGGPQQVGRSSTRLHAPPGGASSICFG